MSGIIALTVTLGDAIRVQIHAHVDEQVKSLDECWNDPNKMFPEDL